MKNRGYHIMRWLTGVAAVAIISSLLPADALAGGNARYVLKIATVAPDRSVWMNAYETIADRIAAATGGEVVFKCYPGGVQGDEPTVIRKIRIGQLHGAGFTGTGLSQICPDALSLQLPFLFHDETESARVMDAMDGYLAAVCRQSGYVVLGWPTLGFSYLFSQDPINDITSLRSAKPWLIENDPIGTMLYRLSNVTPISAQVGDVLPGLRSGLIRAVFSPPVGMVSLQWFHSVRYRLDLRIAYSFGALMVTSRQWDLLPAPYQKAITEICRDQMRILNAKVAAQNDEALQVMVQQGIQTTTISDTGLREFRDLSGRVMGELTGEIYSDKVIQMVSSQLGKLREGRAE